MCLSIQCTQYSISTPAFKRSFLDQFEEPQMLVKCQRVELEKRQVDPCKEAQKKNWVESKCLERKPLPTKRRLSGNVHSCINWMYILASRSHYIHALIHLSICSLNFIYSPSHTILGLLQPYFECLSCMLTHDKVQGNWIVHSWEAS